MIEASATDRQRPDQIVGAPQRGKPMRQFLRQAHPQGHCLEAASADEAVSVLESRVDIAVVFTDIQMPGSMDGLKLAAAVRNRWPPIKIVATSGQAKIGPGDLPEGGRFLPKPYSAAEIMKTLGELIAA